MGSAWHPPLYIITGEQGEGKTTFLMNILAELAEKGVMMSGIVAPGYFKDGLRSGFSLTNLATGKSTELCSVTPSPDSKYYGRYFFRSEGISFGCKAILDPHEQGKHDLLIIDEVGRFELNGAMWADCINCLMSMLYPPMIWTVRRCFVDEVAKRWPIPRTIVVDISLVSQAEIIRDLLEEVRVFRSEGHK